MLESIKVINVGFGDSFILNGNVSKEKYKILVDCGTKNSIDPRVITLVNSSLSKTVSYGILSHFHDDHYKYLEKLDPNVEEFFLPNYLSPLNVSILVKAYLLYRNNTSVRKDSETMLRLDKIASCINPKGKLTFISIKKNNPIQIIDEYRVLSPVKENEKNKKELIKKIDSFFTKQQLVLISEFSENFLSYLGEGIQYEDVISCSIEQANFQKLKNDLLNLEEMIDVQKIKNNFSLTNGILKNQHKYCIVFDRTVKNEIPILFLGDVDKSIYRKSIYPIIRHINYKYVKIIHHGTNPYYLEIYPKSEFFIISNGSYRNWGISERYPRNNVYRKTKLICTDNNGCIYFNNNKKTCSRNYCCGLKQLSQVFY